MLNLLGKIWRDDPDLRLGQIIVNAIRPTEPTPEVFHAEDDRLLEGLTRLEEMMARTPDEGPDQS